MSARGTHKRGADAMDAVDDAGASTSSTKDTWATSFTWCIEGFSKLTSEPMYSDSFEAGICTWRMKVHPEGFDEGNGSHLSVYIEPQDDMWEPSVEYMITVVNQADAGKSLRSTGDTCKFYMDESDVSIGDDTIMKLTELRDAAAGWLKNDTLALTVEVTVEREDRFQLDAGGVPCDVTLKLPCGVEVPVLGQSLRAASRFFRDALEDIIRSAPMPVDGSLGSWAYILSDLHQQREPPALTLGGVFTLLPVAHKYNFTKLLTRLVAFVKDRRGDLGHNPDCRFSYIVCWLELSERLQLDEILEMCLNRLRGMTKQELQTAILVHAASSLGTFGMERGIRKEVQQLQSCCKLFAICMAK